MKKLFILFLMLWNFNNLFCETIRIFNGEEQTFVIIDQTDIFLDSIKEIEINEDNEIELLKQLIEWRTFDYINNTHLDFGWVDDDDNKTSILEIEYYE